MFIEDIKNDFYNILLGNRVLLLVHYDVDAICTCKILQELFKCDNVLYTLIPVGGISELKTAYEENNEEVKFVVLVNCGGTIDIVDILQPEEDVVFFILDTHKPTDVCNVYSDSQVRLVYKDSEENIPNFDDIFRDDEDEEEEQPETGREGLEAAVERRRERRAWEERRHTLMFNYTQFSYYGKPSALVVLELSWRLSRCDTLTLWCASVASAAQTETSARDGPRCLLDAESLHRHIAVAAGAAPDNDHSSHVIVEKELLLPLYRRWSLVSALTHSPHVAPHLRLHRPQGEARVRRLLADMGLPLQQARQHYRAMDVQLRRELLASLEARASQHHLPTVSRAAFLLRSTLAPTLPAADMLYVMQAYIEHDTLCRAEGFQTALGCLTVSTADNKQLEAGAARAQACLQAVAAVVNGSLQAGRLRLAGPFSYFTVPEGTPEARLVRGPFWLGVAARWMSLATGAARPIIASAPLSGTDLILLGVPPRFTHEPRNLFGAAFENAASRSGASVSLDHFDSDVITLPASQCQQFLDALTALLS